MRAAPERIDLPVLRTARPREDELARDGWTRRFVAAPPRLDEMVALYRSLGLDVTLEPLDAREIDIDCAGCVSSGADARIIFTREPR
jgi:hypothetical protein